MGIIGSLRKHSWVAVALVGIAIIAFILGDLTKNNRSIPDVGKVNGETMTRQRFDYLVDEMENNYKTQYQTAQVPSEVQSQIREQVWQDFVNEAILEEQTAKLGMNVTAAEVSDMFTGTFISPTLRQYFTNPQTGQYDYAGVSRTIESLNQMDTAMRMQWVELEKNVKKERLQQKYAGLIMSGFYMPKTLAALSSELGSQAANVRVAALPIQSVSDEEVTLDDADFTKYYNEHKADFRIVDNQGHKVELRDLEFITYPVNPSPADLAEIEANVNKVWDEFQTVEDVEVPFFVNTESHTSYDSSYRKPSDFKAPFDAQVEAASAGTMIAPQVVGNEWMMAKVMATAVRPDSLRASVIYVLNSKAGSQITTRSEEQAKVLADSVFALVSTNKMPFEAAVEQFSDDPQKSETKGDMNWQLDGSYGVLNEQIVNTPVGGCFLYERPDGIGYFIVKVTDKTPANKKYRVALITQEIVPSKATNDAVYAAAHKFAASNRALASMEASAQEENLQVRQARITAMSESLAGVPSARDIVRWAFDEKTKVGDVADQVYECDGMYVVAALKDVFEQGKHGSVGYASLEQVRPMIEVDVRREKKADLLMARAEEACKNTHDINALAGKLGVTVDTIDSVAFNSYYFGRFGMEPMVLGTIAATQNGFAGPVKGASGIYMLQVDNKVKVDAADPEAVRNQVMQGFRSKVRMLTAVLYNNAKIVDNRNQHF